MRFFNTAGPCEPDRHYMLPAAQRLPEARELIDKGGYLVLHAPRQSGKTTTLRALAHELTKEGRYAALYLSCKPAETAGGDVVGAQQALLGLLRSHAQLSLPAELLPPEPWPDAPSLLLLYDALRVWAAACPRPLVLFFDEIAAAPDHRCGLRAPGLRRIWDLLGCGSPRPPHLAAGALHRFRPARQMRSV